MATCPYCKRSLGHKLLKGVMDELHSGPLQCEVFFKTDCCSRDMKATNDFGIYYVSSVPPKEGNAKQMIGAK